MNDSNSIDVRQLRPGDVVIGLFDTIHRSHHSSLVRLIVGVEHTGPMIKITYAAMNSRTHVLFGAVSSVEIHGSRDVNVTLAWKKT